jgi:methylated-DNA-[protein]-cysteine S-methyltransferase
VLGNSDRLLKFLKALGDETRQRMIALLAESVRPSGELAELLGVSPATCSHHLSRLAELGLVTVKKEGNFRFYSLERDALDEFKRGALALLPSVGPELGASRIPKGASGEQLGTGRLVHGWVALDGDTRLEVSLSLTSDRRLEAITPGRLVQEREKVVSGALPEIAALNSCLGAGAALSVDRRWREIKLAIAGSMVWGVKLADGLSPFQQKVFRHLLKVPAGSTVTYGVLADAAGSSPRAVGRALARNPWPLLVPCHRVVRSDGGLGGYSARAGVRLKRELLAFEASAASSGPAASTDETRPHKVSRVRR